MRPIAAYVGRFAPSPTGPLHFGSLVTATASYLEARSVGGRWHVRIDDLDAAREVPGAADDILRTLTAFGFEWDGPVVYQSRRAAAYGVALDVLRAGGHVFECSCSRADLGSADENGQQRRYPGSCRRGPLHPGRALASRFLVAPVTVTFIDAIQGRVSQDVSAEVGDFVVRRRDGFWAYQLAVVVDDIDLGVTHVVRGADLLTNTPRQILLQRALGLPEPEYAHLPVAVDAAGTKLSKATQAAAVSPVAAGPLLWQALNFLEQFPPSALAGAPVRELWAWAAGQWSMARLQGMRSKAAPPACVEPGTADWS